MLRSVESAGRGIIPRSVEGTVGKWQNRPLGAMLYGDPLQRIQILREYANVALHSLLTTHPYEHTDRGLLMDEAWKIADQMFQREYEHFYNSVEEEGGPGGLAKNGEPTVR